MLRVLPTAASVSNPFPRPHPGEDAEKNRGGGAGRWAPPGTFRPRASRVLPAAMRKGSRCLSQSLGTLKPKHSYSLTDEQRSRGLVNEAGQSQARRVPGASLPATRKPRAACGPAVTPQNRLRPDFVTYTASSGFPKRRCGARRRRVNCPQNSNRSSARRWCGQCNRPARFKFPGGSAFRLAGSSLRYEPIGGFEKPSWEGGGPRA